MGRRPERPVGADGWATCRELIPTGSVYAFLAEHRDSVFPETMFADMYPSPNGRPSVPPQVLATATVLQVLANLTDWDTVTHLRCDLRWKAACGVGVNETALDPALLSYL